MTDNIDRKILNAIQQNSRRSISETAEIVGLSLSACHRRIANLEAAGIIQGYSANLNGAALGFKVTFFIEVSLDSQTETALMEFEQAAIKRPDILECHLMTGQADYLIKVTVADTYDYERIYRKSIASLPHVRSIQSSLVMKTVKRWNGYLLNVT